MPWRLWPKRKKIPRITLRITPSLATVSPGGSASSTLEVEMTEVKASIALFASNVPSWATVTFNPQAGVPPFKSEMWFRLPQERRLEPTRCSSLQKVEVRGSQRLTF